MVYRKVRSVILAKVCERLKGWNRYSLDCCGACAIKPSFLRCVDQLLQVLGALVHSVPLLANVLLRANFQVVGPERRRSSWVQ